MTRSYQGHPLHFIQYSSNMRDVCGPREIDEKYHQNPGRKKKLLEVWSSTAKKISSKRTELGYVKGHSSTMLVRRVEFLTSICVTWSFKDTVKNFGKRLEVRIESAKPCESGSASKRAPLKAAQRLVEIACNSQHEKTR